MADFINHSDQEYLFFLTASLELAREVLVSIEDLFSRFRFVLIVVLCLSGYDESEEVTDFGSKFT